jgi:hypothetical protein
MPDEESEVKLSEHVEWNDCGIIGLLATAERCCDMGLLPRGREQIQGHVFDEDTLALNSMVSISPQRDALQI